MRSHGARLLTKTGETQDEIAAAIGVSRVAVSNWLNGKKKPGPGSREKLEARYRVPAGSWDEEPPKVAPSFPLPSSAPSLPVPSSAAFGSGTLAKVAQLEQMAADLLTNLANDEESFPQEKAKVMASIAATYNLTAKLNGEFDLGSRLFKLPIWRAIEKALELALTGHPAAAAAVAREFRKLDDSAGR